MLSFKKWFLYFNLQKFHLLSSSIRGKNGSDEQKMGLVTGGNNDENELDDDEEESPF